MAKTLPFLAALRSITGATASVVGGSMQVISDTDGTGSSVVITETGSGGAALGVFGFTAGTATGNAFAPHNFISDNQALVVTVDGGAPQTITVSAICNTATNCAAGISPTISGATAVSMIGGFIQIKSDTAGNSSSVVITDAGSGLDALALFGTPAHVNGTGTMASVNGTVAVEPLSVAVDGHAPQMLELVVDCLNATECAAALSSAISGATAAVSDGGSVQITSETAGMSSSVEIIEVGSGPNALSLFGTAVSVMGTISVEPLLVTVDGGPPQVLNLSMDCDTIHNCVAALNAAISNASVETKAPVVMFHAGGDHCSIAAPCPVCSGDCDRDSHCQAGLTCHQRDRGGAAPPGCAAGGAGDVDGHDYCVLPASDLPAFDAFSHFITITSDTLGTPLDETLMYDRGVSTSLAALAVVPKLAEWPTVAVRHCLSLPFTAVSLAFP